MENNTGRPNGIDPIKQEVDRINSTNFMHAVPDSQFYTDLSQLHMSLTVLRDTRIDDVSSPNTIYFTHGLNIEIDYILKGIKNTIDKGYKLVKDEEKEGR